MDEMKISFPGGIKVNADYKGFSIATDQPKEEGGEDSAPEPYDLFLASIGTCAGIYVLSFCRERDLDIEGLRMSLQAEKDEKTRLFSKVRLNIHLPPGFPEKYAKAVKRAAGLCTVKRSLADPPDIEVRVDR
ncbi:MAG: OsmC family protein [Thermodesulfobacteriota bacterium]